MKNKMTVLALALVGGVVLSFLVMRKKQDAPKGVESPRPIVVHTAYEQGFATGYQAFLNQIGRPDPSPIKIAKYSSNVPEDEDEKMRGYVDGYHKATESFNCPRSAY